MSHIFGTLAVIASLMIITLGLPAQIIKNYRRKSCDGIDQMLVYSVCTAYALWGLYGLSKPDWFLVTSQLPGLAMALVLLFQAFYYRRKRAVFADEAHALLGLFYLPEMIYLREVVYTVNTKSARARFRVPMAHTYSCQSLGYVTASQHLMCQSQLAYALLGFLVRDKTAEFNFTDLTKFQRLMAECKMWFRRMDLHYVRNIAKDTDFELTMTLNKVRVVKGFAICVLRVNGPVYGELEFVAPL